MSFLKQKNAICFEYTENRGFSKQKIINFACLMLGSNFRIGTYKLGALPLVSMDMLKWDIYKGVNLK